MIESPSFQDARFVPESFGKQQEFLTWHILDNSGLSQLWDLPREDLEVAKSSLILDRFSDLTLEQKREFLGFRIWEISGKFGQVKKYLSGIDGPRLESWMEHVWDKPEKRRKYQAISYEFDFLDEIDGNRSDIIRIMMLLKRIDEFRSQGYSDEQILDMRDKIIYLRSHEYSYLRFRWIGFSDDQIAQMPSFNTVKILEIKEKLLKYGFLSPEKSEEPALQGKVEDPRLRVVEKLAKQGMDAKRISFQTGYSKAQTYRLLSALYYEGRAIPQPEKTESNKIYRDFVANVESLITYTAEPMTKNEIAEILNSTPKAVEGAITILRMLGRIPYVDRNLLARKKAKVNIKLLNVHLALIQFQAFCPGKLITLKELRELSGVNLSDKSLSKYYNEVLRQDPSLPQTKVGAYERARIIILELIKDDPSKRPNFTELQRLHGINHNTFSRAYRSVV